MPARNGIKQRRRHSGIFIMELDRYNLWKKVFTCRRDDQYDCCEIDLKDISVIPETTIAGHLSYHVPITWHQSLYVLIMAVKSLYITQVSRYLLSNGKTKPSNYNNCIANFLQPPVRTLNASLMDSLNRSPVKQGKAQVVNPVPFCSPSMSCLPEEFHNRNTVHVFRNFHAGDIQECGCQVNV